MDVVRRPRIPGDNDRHVIVGATGSGKTQAAQHHLSYRNFDRFPWIIYDFKIDESLSSIPGVIEIGLDELPESPGVYIVHPTIEESKQGHVEAQMRAIWKRGHTGVYIDEGYMIDRKNEAFNNLLTQGRSKRIPMIILSQRPVWMSRFVFTESSFLQAFRLQSKDDVKTVQKFFPDRESRNLEMRLPEYCSHYYDVGADYYTRLRPAPRIEEIHATFARRLTRRERAV